MQELIDIMDRLKVPQEKRPKICPKIEKPQAETTDQLKNVENILIFHDFCSGFCMFCVDCSLCGDDVAKSSICKRVGPFIQALKENEDTT